MSGTTRATTTAMSSEAGSAVQEPRSDAASGIQHLSTETSLYVVSEDRYVVMLAASYPATGSDSGNPEFGMADAREAAYWALQLTRDAGSDGTHWYVLDRQTGEVHDYEQSDLARGDER